MEDAHRTPLSDSHVCECGQAIQSAEHLSLYCSRYIRKQERNWVIVRYWNQQNTEEI